MKPLLLLLFVVPCFAFGQGQPTEHQRRNLVKFTPLKLVGFSNASVEVSYERILKKDISLEFMGSYLLDDPVYSSATNVKGARFSFSVRKYINKTSPKGFYGAVEIDYLITSYDAVLEFYDPDEIIEDSYDHETYADDISIDKQMSTLNFKGGYQFVFKSITLDVNGGIGLRYKDVIHSGKEDPDSIMDNHFEPNFDDFINAEGHYWIINIPLNVKIGYAF